LNIDLRWRGLVISWLAVTSCVQWIAAHRSAYTAAGLTSLIRLATDAFSGREAGARRDCVQNVLINGNPVEWDCSGGS
jgi:hypothetical protein